MLFRSYNSKVLIGNWSEDLELKELRIKEFMERKGKSELLLSKTQTVLQQNLSPVELTVSEDGNVRYGDVIMLFNHATSGPVAVNMADPANNMEGAYNTTTAQSSEPQARTAFTIERAPSGPSLMGHSDDIVRYGDLVHLVCHQALSSDKVLFLQSELITPTKYSKYSRHQQVVVSEDPDYNTVWRFAAFDPQYRVEMEGEPVTQNATVLLMHQNTNQCLGSTKKAYRNLFGVEWEMFAKTLLDSHKAEKDENKFSIMGGK